MLIQGWATSNCLFHVRQLLRELNIYDLADGQGAFRSSHIHVARH